jgi:peptidoglycan DL-endopeptidase CwlO
VSVAALVRYVGDVLGRGHALFGQPGDSRAAANVATSLHAAGRRVRAGRRQFAELAGDFAASYDGFAGRTQPNLHRMGRLDERFGRTLTDAAGTDQRGYAQSGEVIDGAAADTAMLAPLSGTPAGESLLIAQLRRRVVRQQHLIAAYRARDAQLAAILRSMHFRGRMGPGASGTPWSSSVFSGQQAGGLGSTPGLSGLAMSRLTQAAASRNTHRIHLAARRDPRGVPAGPAGAAVAAALTRQGDPYVWGAKGPNRFDCSGLTQWAWRQAGVQLGGDTYSQIHDGVAVPQGQARAGDLIFPNDSFDGHGPGHVQLAISPTAVIHAPQPGDVVRVAPMPSSYVARRPVPSQ